MTKAIKDTKLLSGKSGEDEKEPVAKPRLLATRKVALEMPKPNRHGEGGQIELLKREVAQLTLKVARESARIRLLEEAQRSKRKHGTFVPPRKCGGNRARVPLGDIIELAVLDIAKLPSLH